jgi:hypothetical protein
MAVCRSSKHSPSEHMKLEKNSNSSYTKNNAVRAAMFILGLLALYDYTKQCENS